MNDDCELNPAPQGETIGNDLAKPVIEAVEGIKSESPDHAARHDI